jgi:hypothetical protein
MSARIGFHCQVVHWRTVPVHQHDARKSWNADRKQCGVATALTEVLLVAAVQRVTVGISRHLNAHRRLARLDRLPKRLVDDAQFRNLRLLPLIPRADLRHAASRAGGL